MNAIISSIRIQNSVSKAGFAEGC